MGPHGRRPGSRDGDPKGRFAGLPRGRKYRGTQMAPRVYYVTTEVNSVNGLAATYVGDPTTSPPNGLTFSRRLSRRERRAAYRREGKVWCAQGYCPHFAEVEK